MKSKSLSQKRRLEVQVPKFPWEHTTRRESGLIEHVCKHGVGHPAIGSVQFMEFQGKKGCGVHGCDGCCQTEDWCLTDAVEGCRTANRILAGMLETPKNKETQNYRIAKALGWYQLNGAWIHPNGYAKPLPDFVALLPASVLLDK